MSVSAVTTRSFSPPAQVEVPKMEQVLAMAKALGVEYNQELLQDPIYAEVFEKVVNAIYCDSNHFFTPTETHKELQEIAYQYLDHSEEGMQNVYQDILRVALYSTHTDDAVIATVLLKALEAKLARPAAPALNVQKKEFPIWGTGEKIVVTYGGGERLLKAFREGKTEGYTSENGAVGIFVTTERAFRKRDFQYATRTPILHFDNPCVLSAKIDPKYLLKVNYNSYEAMLPAEHVRFLEDVDVNCWNMIDLPLDERRSCFAQTLPLNNFLKRTQDSYIVSKMAQISRWHDYLLNGFKPRFVENPPVLL